MLLPEIKEREYRFKLALRIGLPIFGLILILIFTTLVQHYDTLNSLFYIESAVLLFVSIYFILYLIYVGFNVKITDDITKTFSREYFYDYIKKEIEKNQKYTLMLVSIDNLSDINNEYGIKNGDRVLKKTVEFISEFFRSKDIENFPIGHIKGGDFVIGLKGDLADKLVLSQMLCIKGESLSLNGIEINISTAVTDTTLTKNLDDLIDTLFEYQEQNRLKKTTQFMEIDPKEIEKIIDESIKNSSVYFMSQNVYDKDKNIQFTELYPKLKTKEGKYIHQKKYTKVLNKLNKSFDFDMMMIKKILENIDRFSYDKICVNIFATTLRDVRFSNFLKEQFEKNDTLKDRVIFVFFENEIYRNLQKFNNILKSYRDIGIKIVIDRLGYSHSSYIYFKELDFDIARFDTDLTKVKNIQENLFVLNGFVSMAKEKGVKTWVRMIETQEQFENLKKTDTDLFEGKFLSIQTEENL